MPGSSGEPVVTTSCAFLFCTRDCGCIERPAFPTPHLVSGVTVGKARAFSRRENAEPCLHDAPPLNLAPLAGRGRIRSTAKYPGEGDYRRLGASPSPARKVARDLSPQAGRGEDGNGCLKIDSRG